MEQHASADRPTSQPPGDQIPLSCPECNGPMYQVSEGDLTRFQCFVGHAFSPESLSEEHTEALERALWTAIRKLKERIVLHEELLKKKRRNEGEEELKSRLEESISTSEQDLKLLRDVLDRI
jgi:two-component system chemotaxis response regulator CheB